MKITVPVTAEYDLFELFSKWAYTNGHTHARLTFCKKGEVLISEDDTGFTGSIWLTTPHNAVAWLLEQLGEDT